MTEDLEAPEGAAVPIRVVERVVSAYQWDAWREVVLNASRKSEIQAILLGTVFAAAVGALGYDILSDSERLSAFIYAPLVGVGVWYGTRSWLARRQLSRVTEELRPIVAPALVKRVTDQQLVAMVRHGGAPFGDEAIVIIAQRQDAAVTLVASVYDVSKFPNWDGGSVGGG